MSVYIRGKKFHYRFQSQGADYSGVCTDCEVFPGMNQREIAAVRKKAVQFEADESPVSPKRRKTLLTSSGKSGGIKASALSSRTTSMS